MAGLIGSSNSPISGIGIIAIALVSLLLLAILGSQPGLLGDPRANKLAIAIAIFITSVVLAIATISNDNLQDLKTGLLVGATPWRQQVALIVGRVCGALGDFPDPRPALQRLWLRRRASPPRHGPDAGARSAPGNTDVGNRCRNSVSQTRLDDGADGPCYRHCADPVRTSSCGGARVLRACRCSLSASGSTRHQR